MDEGRRGHGRVAPETGGDLVLPPFWLRCCVSCQKFTVVSLWASSAAAPPLLFTRTFLLFVHDTYPPFLSTLLQRKEVVLLSDGAGG